MPIASKFQGLPAYAVVCLPVAPSSASLSSITFPESSSVGLQSSAVNALPTSMTTNPVVLPVPKLPIPRIATVSLPAAYKTRAWVSADKTKTRNVGNKKSTKVSERKKCSRGVPGGTDLEVWIQTQVCGKSSQKGGHSSSLPATSVPTATSQSDGEKTRMCGPCASHFSETVVRSLDFSPALSKRSNGCSWYRRPFSEEEDSAGFEILTSDEGHISKSRTRRKQVYPKHCHENDIATNFLDGEIILTKDLIVEAASSQVFPSEDSSSVTIQPRKRAKMALPVSPVLGSSNMDFFSLPCMPTVNPIDLDCDVAQQHNISVSLGDSLTAPPETSTPIRNQPTASLQQPRTSPVVDVLPLSPVSTFFENMADIFVSASPPHMFLPVSGNNLEKADFHRVKDLTSSADFDDGFLPELKTPPSRWGWAGRCHLELARSGGHPMSIKDEIGLVQNPNDYFQESNLLDMYEAPSFNLSPQHFHLKCSPPCSNNKFQGYPKQTLTQEDGGYDTRHLVHTLNQSTEFHHQNISHNTGQHTMLAGASRTTLDVNKFCCFIKSVPQMNANSGNTSGIAEQNVVNRELDLGQALYTYQQPQTMTKTTGTNQCKNSDKAILQNVGSSATQNPSPSQNQLVHKSSHPRYHFEEQQCQENCSFWYNQQHHSDLGTCYDLYKGPQMTHNQQCMTFFASNE